MSPREHPFCGYTKGSEIHEEQFKEVQKVLCKMQKDLEILSIKTQQQEQLQEKESIIDRYKKALSASLEWQKSLAQRMVQQEVEWQKKCEDIQTKLYLDKQMLIQELTSTREKMNAELVETKVQLQELTGLLQCVTEERDLALQRCVPNHGPLPSDEINALKQQNYRLQAVVSEMRKQMEELSCTTPPHQTELENSMTKEVEISQKDVQILEPNVTVNKKRSCECVNSEKSALTQLRSRLKRAALCIARLNRDREQLTELCNRLRAQACTAELRSHSDGNMENDKAHEISNNLKTGNSGKGPSVSVDRAQSSLPHCSSAPVHGKRPSHEVCSEPVPDAQIEVCGVSAAVHTHSTASSQRKVRPKITAKTVRVRNYNIKD